MLKDMLGDGANRGSVDVQDIAYLPDDVTVLIGMTGDLQGVVLYGMSSRSAKNMVGAMMGEVLPVLNEMVESGIAELGNIIAGQAAIELEKMGYNCRISPPSVLLGRGYMISTVNIKGLHLPLETSHGKLRIYVALREATPGPSGGDSSRLA
ncbi:MAG: chemotaxis protein CheX [Bacillota bacterium]